MDGYKATRRIREEEKQGKDRTAIVAMTANALASDRQECLNVGMDDYLTKPIKQEDLIKALQKYSPQEVIEDRGHILLVEDSLSKRLVFKNILVKTGDKGIEARERPTEGASPLGANMAQAKPRLKSRLVALVKEMMG